MNSLINPRKMGGISVRDEQIAMGRDMTNKERGAKAYSEFRGSTGDISDSVWVPALKRLGDAIRDEFHLVTVSPKDAALAMLPGH